MAVGAGGRRTRPHGPVRSLLGALLLLAILAGPFLLPRAMGHLWDRSTAPFLASVGWAWVFALVLAIILLGGLLHLIQERRSEHAVRCPACGSGNPRGYRHCDACGQPLAIGSSPVATLEQALEARRRTSPCILLAFLGFLAILTLLYLRSHGAEGVTDLAIVDGYLGGMAIVFYQGGRWQWQQRLAFARRVEPRLVDASPGGPTTYVFDNGLILRAPDGRGGTIGFRLFEGDDGLVFRPAMREVRRWTFAQGAYTPMKIQEVEPPMGAVWEKVRALVGRFSATLALLEVQHTAMPGFPPWQAQARLRLRRWWEYAPEVLALVDPMARLLDTLLEVCTSGNPSALALAEPRPRATSAPGATGSSMESQGARLVAAPRIGYRGGWRGLAAGLGVWGILTLLALAAGGSAMAVAVASGALPMALVLGMFAAVSRHPMVLEADERGMRLRHGARILELPWGEVQWVRHGLGPVRGGRNAYVLRVQGPRPSRRVLINDSGYGVDRGQLEAFARRVEDMARAHSVPVQPTQYPRR